MNKITIRKATLKDLNIVQSLSQELFEHDYQCDKFLNLDW